MRLKYVVSAPSVVVMLVAVSTRSPGLPYGAALAADPFIRPMDLHTAVAPATGVQSEESLRRGKIAFAARTSNRGDTLPLLIDGAKTPERVPDSVAYRHFLSVTTVARNASPELVARRDAFLALVDLPPSDIPAFQRAVAGVKDEVVALDALRAAHGQVDEAAAATLRQQRAEVFDSAAARVLATLSPEGVRRLRTHIDGRVKRQIKIYGQTVNQ